MKKRYPSDLTDAQWRLIEPLLPPELPGGRDRTTDLREVTNALLYMSKTGCQWRMLPTEFPPRSTVFGYSTQWKQEGIHDEILATLREQIREKAGRNKTPTAGIIDSQTAKSIGSDYDIGYDGGKKIKGRKRHIVVDILGLLLGVSVTSADVQDREASKSLIKATKTRFPTLEIIFADGGYTGEKLSSWFKITVNLILKIIKRPRKKFQVVKFRWIVERTFGWINHHRRLSKDYEYLPASSEAWVKIASWNMMLKRLSPG